MSDALPGSRLPAWVRLENGGLVPFDPDATQQTIFAALARCGTPDAFLCRELTDSVHHFLAERLDAGTVSRARLDEVVVQILRELGHARLAAVLGSSPAQPSSDEATPTAERAALLDIRNAVPRRRAAAHLRRFAAARVFSPQVMALVSEGWLDLSALRHPHCVETRLRHPHAPLTSPSTEPFEELATRGVCLDSPEHALALADAGVAGAVDYVRRLGGLSLATGQRLSLHVNVEPPPPWAETDFRPLFPPPPHWDAHLDAIRERLLSAALPSFPLVRWTLHLQGSPPPAWVTCLARRLERGAGLDLIWDRPRQPVRLDVGLSRKLRARLQTIDLNLRQLWARGGPWNVDAWIGRLLLLARMALTAGVQHREFLRRLAPPQPDFVLDHAGVQLRLRGLAPVARQMFPSVPRRKAVVEFVQRLADRLTALLRREYSTHGLWAAVSWSWQIVADDLENELERASRIQAHMPEGRARLVWPRMGASPDKLNELLRIAGRLPSLGRLSLRMAPRAIPGLPEEHI